MPGSSPGRPTTIIETTILLHGQYEESVVRYPAGMPRIAPELDTPFRTGEKVITTGDLPGVPEGTRGKVKLVNGLNTWIRYWVKFENGTLLGQISQLDLVRPDMRDAWQARAESLASAAAAGAGTAGTPGGGSATDEIDAPPADGVAGLIPAMLLERSQAAKARLLG